MRGHVLEMSTLAFSASATSPPPSLEGEKVKGRNHAQAVSQLMVSKLTVVAGQIWLLHIG